MAYILAIDIGTTGVKAGLLDLASMRMLGVAARTVLIAILANTLVKSGLVLSLAAPALKRALLPGAGLLAAAGAAAAILVG